MLGFLKRKKKDSKDEKSKPDPPAADGQEVPSEDAPKKKKFSLKLILMILGILIAVGASGFVVYKFWFAGKGDKAEEAPRVYKKMELGHVGLPEEMIRFTFDHFPDLYQAFIDYNSEITLFDNEISRIEGIGTTYPDQVKIADKEKKIWEKARDTLKKAFIKLEKPVKETYVLFRVNKDQGLARIEELNNELAQSAIEALKPAQEMTQKLKQTEPVPEGMVKGTIYKLKKKFL